MSLRSALVEGSKYKMSQLKKAKTWCKVENKMSYADLCPILLTYDTLSSSKISSSFKHNL